jgi:hypothetical protein
VSEDNNKFESKRMKVLVACEFSGIVRDAFIARGHDAVSCDLLPTEKPGPHIQGDVKNILRGWPLCPQCKMHCILDRTDYRCDRCCRLWPYSFQQETAPWDLMIAHPPCTHLAVSGARWFKEKQREQREALDFVKLFMDAPIKRICIENPISIISSKIRKPDQIIQPWMFGHGETKSTCLWLKNLPKLTPTDVVVPEWAIRADGSIHMSKKGKRDNPTHFLTGRNTRVLSGPQLEQWNRIHKMPPGPDRWKERSRTYQGIADAMAEQWGNK